MMDLFKTLSSFSEEQTMQYAYTFGQSLPLNSIVCFYGDLGAGKTTFIKGLVAGATNYMPTEVNSPTFVYMNIYEGQKTIYHFDLYRLPHADEFLGMGFEDLLYANGICCIEWAERIQALIPPHAISVEIQHKGENRRNIVIKSGKPA
ncbi:tRNA (adenosine(37)-N6)-threonylcarbamoyltransferase complex ATPase subunit type 1 TsaE [Parachlamydia sp. AcF125]|uniref:tRNA (adenosine(37)-N6)-threonylcarbamoyltransferase complex ATPase subunit type 1 TsaE n=1 Tax=Parachlamydia sp. AcF125 TaxID=2795736 RepID=UPI001BC972E4|nr:tRNA (adenosine(37)-N6)-threonylcarbamoyltransferase complex ATPase subunit type 1 TsaE [Parachlamydia sp. AcF125]MBS4167757.1 tRNA threonylcarbamoyladenosine biosynthesis protein TsaE [Parachlamydia sp. AcF125]